MQNALQTFLSYNELEYQIHQEYNKSMKEQFLEEMVQLRRQLKSHKDNWKHKPEIYKKRVKEETDKLEKEKNNYRMISKEVDKLRKKKSDLYKKYNIVEDDIL